MSTYKKISLYIKENRYFVFRYIPLSFIVFIIAFMLLMYPETAAQGITDGVDICLGALVPSLYPFMVLSAFVVNSNLLSGFSKALNPVMQFLFALPGDCVGTVLMSVTGGFPVGGKMVQALYESGKITDLQAQRLLLFCVNPGPAFVISTVGLYMLGSKYVGTVLFLTLIISTFIMAILSRFFCSNGGSYLYNEKKENSTSISQALVNSVSQGSLNILSVCAWVLLFSCIGQLIDMLPFSDEFKFFSCCISEVTNACLCACGIFPLPIIAGIIAFGGICVHCQIMSAVVKVKLKLKYFLAARVLNAGIAVVVCQALLYIFPVTQQTVALGTKPDNLSSVSAPVSICMLISCVLFLLGDSFKLKLRKDKL